MRQQSPCPDPVLSDHMYDGGHRAGGRKRNESGLHRPAGYHLSFTVHPSLLRRGFNSGGAEALRGELLLQDDTQLL